MSVRSKLSDSFAQLRSLDFWLFVATFMIAGFSLQEFQTFGGQLAFLFGVIAIAISISVARKRSEKWMRRNTGLKGKFGAVFTAAFGVYAFWFISSHFNARFGVVDEIRNVQEFLSALSHPRIFSIVGPFMCLFVYAIATSLGLTDIEISADDA